MKYLLLLLSLSLAYTLNAQSNYKFDSLQLYHRNFKPDSKLVELQNQALKLPDNLMISLPQPQANKSVLKLPDIKLAYITKSNNLDIYKAPPDNMYVVKPDGSVAFNMPVKKSIIYAEPSK